MCVIIAKPKGVDPIKKEYFENAWQHNSQGGGVVWKTPEGEVMMQKGFMDKDTFLAKLDEINQKDNAFIAHFRIKSVGEVNPENTHPFAMSHVTFAHNGTISSIKPIEGKTDSETFGLWFLKDRSMKWIKDNSLLLELALGTSKFALMDNKTGEIHILNREYGQERDGAWFSNTSAFPYVAPKTTSSAYSGGYWRGNTYYSSHYDDDYDCLSCSRSTAIKANKQFGTKGYTHQYAEYDAERGCFVYTASKSPVFCAYLSAAFVENRRGFWTLDKKYQPLDSFKDMPKEMKRPINKVLGTYTQYMCKCLREYYRADFDSILERSENEQEISALYCLLDVCRRLVRAGKVIDEETLDKMLLERVPSYNADKSAFLIYLEGYVTDLLDDLYPERKVLELAV